MLPQHNELFHPTFYCLFKGFWASNDGNINCTSFRYMYSICNTRKCIDFLFSASQICLHFPNVISPKMSVCQTFLWRPEKHMNTLLKLCINSITLLKEKNTRSSHRRYSLKRMFLKSLQYFKENICIGVSFW